MGRKAVDVGQSHALMAVLAQNVDWSQLDSDVVQRIIMAPKESGAQFTAFLRNGGRSAVKGSKVVIDRSKPFDPVEFIGEKGWSIAEQDERALRFTEVDLNTVLLKTMLEGGESYVVGEEKLRRLKAAEYIRLDAGVFLALWQNPALIPASWQGKAVFFDGTILLSPGGGRCVLCLFWHGWPWCWGYFGLSSNFSDSRPSAVLAGLSAAQ
ncbi:hypothetical protein HY932_01730 [Candidatus Falkowbacteria bacterium]|nr:hypothetical protein [Candidatus Falkowbacteria bacterium]